MWHLVSIRINSHHAAALDRPTPPATRTGRARRNRRRRPRRLRSAARGATAVAVAAGRMNSAGSSRGVAVPDLAEPRLAVLVEPAALLVVIGGVLALTALMPRDRQAVAREDPPERPVHTGRAARRGQAAGGEGQVVRHGPRSCAKDVAVAAAPLDYLRSIARRPSRSYRRARARAAWRPAGSGRARSAVAGQAPDRPGAASSATGRP